MLYVGTASRSFVTHRIAVSILVSSNTFSSLYTLKTAEKGTHLIRTLNMGHYAWVKLLNLTGFVARKKLNFYVAKLWKTFCGSMCRTMIYG